jgi:hypothetical protein
MAIDRTLIPNQYDRVLWPISKAGEFQDEFFFITDRRFNPVLWLKQAMAK